MEFDTDCHRIWQALYRQQLPGALEHACKDYLAGFEYLGLPEDQATRATMAVSSLEDIRNRAEADAIRQTLKLRHRNIKMAASDLKISRPTLYRLLEKHRIAPREEGDVEQA